MGAVARQTALLPFVATAFAIHGTTMMVAPIFPLFVQEIVPTEQNVASIVGLILGAAGVVGAISALVSWAG